jgi:hypothetical protein
MTPVGGLGGEKEADLEDIYKVKIKTRGVEVKARYRQRINENRRLGEWKNEREKVFERPQRCS